MPTSHPPTVDPAMIPQPERDDFVTWRNKITAIMAAKGIGPVCVATGVPFEDDRFNEDLWNDTVRDLYYSDAVSPEDCVTSMMYRSDVVLVQFSAKPNPLDNPKLLIAAIQNMRRSGDWEWAGESASNGDHGSFCKACHAQQPNHTAECPIPHLPDPWAAPAEADPAKADAAQAGVEPAQTASTARRPRP